MYSIGNNVKLLYNSSSIAITFLSIADNQIHEIRQRMSSRFLVCLFFI